MGIVFDEKRKLFHLQAQDTSYVIQILETGHVAHIYWGRKLRSPFDISRVIGNAHIRRWPLEAQLAGEKEPISLTLLPQEYPAYGNTDFREPAYQVAQGNGSTITDLRYIGHQIFPGKPKLPGLPATYVEQEREAVTLELYLFDSLIGLKVVLLYTVFEDYGVITRSVRFINEGKQSLTLNRAMSTCIDFADDQFRLLQLSGAWSRERHVVTRRLVPGIQSIGSARGASSPNHNPFIALLRENADETAGEVYGFSLVYSGNFLAQAEVDHYGRTRVIMGINPFDFSWLLEVGESFQTPEVVMAYTHQGLNHLSQTYHRLYRTRLARGTYRDRVRPILINNWEATYFDFNTEKLVQLAETAKELGIELFVLDDGWFGKRNDDTSSLGDWFVNEEKLPGGLTALGEKITSLGMEFGIWVEPEMVSPNSELYRAHPDWCLHVEGRNRSTSRTQLVLDLTRDDVCDAIVKMISDVLESAPITYVKWDMNRHMTEIGSAKLPPNRQRETAHRYMLGLYRILETLTSRFPNVLFESCSSGGGRFDPGMLYYMPQTWTSDDTDAVERLKIQYGTSIVYPLASIGAHVSAVPNHQVGRVTPLQTRGNVACFGNFGYELDLNQLTQEEKDLIKEQVKRYKEVRELVQMGDFYRLLSPFEGNDTAWMVVSTDKTEALFGFYRVLGKPNSLLPIVRLQGLDPDRRYEIEGTSLTYGGDELMNFGLNIAQHQLASGDFQSILLHLVAVETPSSMNS